MSAEATYKSLDDLTMAQDFQLEELLDKSALRDMVQSFEELFAVGMRLYSASGKLLADTSLVPALYGLLTRTQAGTKAVHSSISAVRGTLPEKGASLVIPCVSGGKYLSQSIVYEGRELGRTILGPFVSPLSDSPSAELVALAQGIDQADLSRAFAALPRLSDEQAEKLENHLGSTLNLLIFSGLKAHLASNMHMASVQESFRELSEKTKKLQVAYQHLKELDRLKSNFLATVSHELRTPLTSIIGYSEMLIEGIAGEISGEQREFLETIHEKGEQLLELIKSLLDLSKLESGTMSLHRAPLDCAALVEQIVSTMTPAARKKDVTFSGNVEAELPLLYADTDRLRQVLNNLSENALKFTPAGGHVVVSARKVLLSAGDAGGVGGVLMAAAQRPAIELRVSDTGIGIPEEERSRVFDAFYQVDNSSTREVGGTGLGLSIVKRLVDAHDGAITIMDNSPKGAVFVVTIPIHNIPNNKAP